MRLRLSRFQSILACCFVLGFAITGTLLQNSSRATTPTAVIEAEDGIQSWRIHNVASATASGNRAILFSTSPPFSTSYTVVGNVIQDDAGDVFVPHGVDRPSLEWGCQGQAVSGGAVGIPASDFVTMHDVWKANIVRIALNQDFWLSGAAKYCASYKSNVAKVVTNAHNAGLRVILDLHWSDANNLANASPGQQCMADQNSVTFWQEVASIYKTDPNVWFELYNEPQNITWSQWRDGGIVCGFSAVGMQTLVDTVRATGADNIVIAGGIGYASHLDGLTLLSGTNITYAIHPYAADIIGGNADSWSASDWNNRFGYLTTSVPVIATEFGHVTCSNSTYDQGILDYFRTHGMGYTAWAWYASSCGFPSLISDAAGTCFWGGCATEADLQKFATGQQEMTIPGMTGTVPVLLKP